MASLFFEILIFIDLFQGARVMGLMKGFYWDFK